MGKDWVYNLSSGEGNNSSSRKRSRKKHNTTTTSTPSGCMNAVFQLFDLNHYFNFPFNSTTSNTTTTDHPQPLPGVVAPRNSLEIEDTSNMGLAALSAASFVKNNPQSLQIPMGGIQIKTRVSTDQDLSSSSESAYISGSPAGTKTPTLVARLMGLDLLPETSSPRPSSSSSSNLSSTKSHLHHLLQKSETRNKRGLPRNDANAGTRSLPETPRTSSSSTRRSDVDQRFSLQSNKENSQLSGHEFEFSKFLTAKIAAAGRQRDENMSPGHYAKQIVKQFKESVSRRVGRDITNTVENRSEQRRDQHVVLLKSKKTTPSNDQKESCSPKLRHSETKNKSITSSQSPKLPVSPLSPFVYESITVPSGVKAQAVEVFEEKQIQQSPVCRKVSTDQKYGSRLYKMPQTSDLIRNKQEESYVKSSASSRAKSRHVNIPDKKCKKSTPLSNVPTSLTVKKDPSPPATRLPHQQEGQRPQHKSSQSQIENSSRNGPPSCLSQINMYKQKGPKQQTVPNLVTHCNKSNATTGGELYHYISKLLKCTGIQDFTAVSITNWYSPCHPLDPSIFHHLRVSESTSTIGQCRLTFDVVDEILAGMLKPYLKLKPWSSWNSKSHVCLEQSLCGSELINILCGRIRSFPSADCRVLEDIDGLIDTDLGKSCWESDEYEEEFSDGIVGDVEGDILERLMHETLLDLLFGVRTMKTFEN
ncbi:DUF4378 domain-containing protein/VARLMGL domain-containing protein [Heracleum sosnowskyi]|uniref:DUF4378 domain-containing protein/VARLMGL domain-containing protein n=1 Tax=Heracleum sosnowskyi TaxID=360622 RepID=A0AAD8M6H3_9APIA|nr:DUF4378 domain-containing protein/VARLMGL domain-containing protein [Heracleum sosnowskyi]